MKISSADPLKGEHSAYAIAVHLEEPLLEQYFVTLFMATYRLDRKLANRVLATQAVGNVFILGARHRGPSLVCCVIGRVPGQAHLSDVNLCLRKAVGLTDANAAVVAEGFRVAHDIRAADEHGMECLQRALKRWGFAGTVYVRPLMHGTDLITVPSEAPTSRRFVSLPDGRLRPSLMPAIVAFGPGTPSIKEK